MTGVLGAVIACAVAAVIVRWVPRVALAAAQRHVWWSLAPAALLGAGAGLVGRHLGEQAALAVVAGAAGVLVVVDLAEQRLPDSVVLPTLALWLLAAVALAASGSAPWSALWGSVLGAALVFGGFLVAAFLARGLLGFGDVKLSALLGAVLGWFGWASVGTGIVAGFLLHGLAALVVLVVTRDLRAEVAMGPALILGGVVGVASGTIGLPW